jgi:hypothetical protein
MVFTIKPDAGETEMQQFDELMGDLRQRVGLENRKM